MPLGGVDVNREQVLSVKINMRRQLKGEWRVAAFVFPKPYPVDPYRRSGHHTFKVDENALAAGFEREA